MPRFRQALLIVLFGGAVTACGTSGQAGPISVPSSGHGSHGAVSADSATVTTKLLDFAPEDLTVKKGTTVVWKVDGGIGHTVTTGTFTLGGDGLRNAEQPDGKVDLPLTKDREVSFTFTEPGSYTYYCSIHKGMNGKVEVTG
ncbi:Plastocyanin [Actinokineospora alba]|uniref:Plastocyanin n=1 Tax=Actinokineospora alba TaxID=504798 RepID=A0A1H0W1P8_9PSEU|nr:plastocyanin/azurin family copper-binding protein [Actinokineospora alba]TDP67773.1 plastocyanin [Actinokineospora alba]SDI71598.1 Plastocyanin [Actinokineospora alba]SDP84619.1 Plastocyanin [Actinokineospora alba]